jgi:CRISPR-associated protein Csd2
MAVATKEEARDQDGDNRTMGKKHTVPYGLYRAHGFISAFYAGDTGFTEEDLQLFWNSLINMFDHDRSAARGEMSARRLIVFKHIGEGESARLGTHPAHKLFETVTVHRKSDGPARSYSDYEVRIDQAAIEKLKGKIELLDLI